MKDYIMSSNPIYSKQIFYQMWNETNNLNYLPKKKKTTVAIESGQAGVRLLLIVYFQLILINILGPWHACFMPIGCFFEAGWS